MNSIDHAGHDHVDDHNHAHDNGHPHDHDHDHDGHSHKHHTGFKGWLFELFVPHTHDSADSIDDALESSVKGVRALKISLFLLLGTTILQFLVVLISGSVALLADTIHNFSDALTAVPLWIAFILGRRAANRRYTYGYGRAEDLAGLFIVAVVALSAVVAAWQSIDRLFNPQPLQNLWWVLAAGVIGFAGNEAVAIYRIRVGRQIGSAALVADGVHARIDGFTSLAVIVLLWGTVKSIGHRLMDGIEPELVARADTALDGTPGVLSVQRLQLRWVGHRLHGTAIVVVADATLSAVQEIAREAEHQLGHALPKLDDVLIKTITDPARENGVDLDPSKPHVLR